MEKQKQVLTELGLYHINLVETPEKPPHDYNPYFWWRRFGTHKSLPSSVHVLEKAKNGDFDPSPYWKQINYEYFWLAQDVLELRKKLGYTNRIEERDLISSYNRRIKKLTEDALLDEDARMDDLYSSIARNYQSDKKQVKKYIWDFAKGTLEECILEFSIWKQNEKTKLIEQESNKIFENFK